MNKIQNTSKYLNTLCKIVKTYKKKTFYNIEYKLEYQEQVFESVDWIVDGWQN